MSKSYKQLLEQAISNDPSQRASLQSYYASLDPKAMTHRIDYSFTPARHYKNAGLEAVRKRKWNRIFVTWPKGVQGVDSLGPKK